MTGGASGGERATSRRRFLALAAAGVGGLAGCGYRSGGGDIRWEVETGTGRFQLDDLLATGGTVFTVNRSRRGFDFETEEWGTSAEIGAYDSTSGDERWTETTPPCGRPAARDGRLYLGHETGSLTALDADGSEDWNASVGAFPYGLAASDDQVYALTDADELVAFATADGDRLWRSAVGASEGATLAVTADGVVVHDAEDANSTSVTAVGRDGEQQWTASLPGDLAGIRPVVADDAVLAATRRSLVVLGRGDGTERWSQGTDYLRGPPAVADGTVYHAAGSALFARDAGNGSLQWRFGELDRTATSPAVADGIVYVAGSESLRAVSAADGSVRWQVDTGGVDAGPLVAENAVVVAASEGVVRAHRRE